MVLYDRWEWYGIISVFPLSLWVRVSAFAPTLPGHPACCHIGRHRMVQPQAGQTSPDKDVNCRYTTAAFTLSPEPWALLCCASLPGDWALYEFPVRLPVRCTQTGRLIALHSALPLLAVALACGSPFALLQPSRRHLAMVPLPSDSTYANRSKDLLAWSTYRGLSPHKLTPMPGVHNSLHPTASRG